jgi:hypothetical protein
MNEEFKKTLKSSETEDWLDLHFVRPFCYYWALLFARLDIHPNTVTILSMFIGAGSAIFFGCASFYYNGIEGLMFNLIAILLLCLADIFDCTDGQLARMTGKKSRLGRILDGVAGFAWFIPIYHAMVYRFYLHHELEFQWLGIEDTPENALIATGIAYALGLISGIMGLAGQQRLADYYIQVHLFFLKGEKGAELDNSEAQKEKYARLTWKDNFTEKLFQKTYVGYTLNQEKVTPQFQRLLAALRQKYGASENIPQKVRDEFCRQSKGLMKYVFMLVFNFRTAYLLLFCLLDVPVLTFVFEVTVMQFIAWYVVHRHEAFCKRIAESL